MSAPADWVPPVQPWYTYKEAAFLLRRSAKTIQNLVYKHRLERKTYWDGRGRHKRRVTDVSPAALCRGHWIVRPPADKAQPGNDGKGGRRPDPGAGHAGPESGP